MAHVICAPCIDVVDKACIEVCPSDAIHLADDTSLAEGDRKNMAYINPDECADCGACADECPVQAIYPEEDVPEEWKEFVEVNAKAFA
jgi:NAD-dependent dihydropyrimidine dehydrogenase PreA subunit